MRKSLEEIFYSKIAVAVSAKTGIPVEDITQDKAERIAHFVLAKIAKRGVESFYDNTEPDFTSTV